MLLTLQGILRRLLYERGQISEQEVDIIFEAPTQERVERIWQPTISLFLYAISENVELRQHSYQTVSGNGRAERRPAPRRFDLRYMVSALSSEIEDEHQLLWRALTTLVRYPQLPDELLPEEVRALAVPLVTKVCQEDEHQQLLGLWSALGAQPRPALAYTVTVPVEVLTVREAPLVLTRTARYTRLRSEEVLETGIQVGGVVRNRSGEALAGVRVLLEGRVEESVTDAAGRFVLRNMPPQRATLRLVPPGGTPRRLTLNYALAQEASGKADPPLAYEIVLDALPEQP
jgi:hypothetical protein